MSIDVSKIKFYAPINSTDPASAGYGGDVNTTATQTSGTLNNEFDDVTNDERISGLVDYRKQFIRNENADSWEEVKVWVASNTPAPDDTIDICQAGTLSLLGATALLGSGTYVESATIVTFASDILFAVRPGEWVYSVTYDGTILQSRQVATVSQYKVTLASAFGSSTAGTDVIAVCPATMFTFSAPASKADGLVIGTIPATTAVGIWKRRTVTAGAAGYANDTFTVRWESR